MKNSNKNSKKRTLYLGDMLAFNTFNTFNTMLAFTRAIEICQADELSLQQLKLFNNDKEVGAINKTRQPRRKYIPKNNPEARKPRQDRDESKTWKTCCNI